MEKTEWYKEEWATDLFADIAKSVFAPKPKEQAPVTPQTGKPLGGDITFGDWIIPVSIIGGIAVILLFVFILK